MEFSAIEFQLHYKSVTLITNQGVFISFVP